MARANTAFNRLTTIAAVSSEVGAANLFLVKSRMGANAAFTAARHAAVSSTLPSLLPTASRGEHLADSPPDIDSSAPLNLDGVFLLDNMELGELFGSDFRL